MRKPEVQTIEELRDKNLTIHVKHHLSDTVQMFKIADLARELDVTKGWDF